MAMEKIVATQVSFVYRSFSARDIDQNVFLIR